MRISDFRKRSISWLVFLQFSRFIVLTFFNNSSNILVSSFRLDFFVKAQTLFATVGVRSSEYFELEGANYLVVSMTTEDACQQSVVMKFNSSNLLSTHQFLTTSGSVVVKFITASWNESYLLVVNSETNCNDTSGIEPVLPVSIFIKH